MPCPEVTAHPATARRKAGGPRRPDADQSWQVNRCSCRHPATAKRNSGGPRRPDADQSWQVTRRSCRARRSRPTLRLQSARQVVRGVPTRIKVGRSLVVRAAPRGHGPPCDCKAQGRWSAASRPGSKLVGHSLFMPCPEVTAHPATAKRMVGGPQRPRRGTKLVGHSLFVPRPEVTAHPATTKRMVGGPRRPDAEQSWQVNRCSCRAWRSRPTLRLQSAR